MVFVVVEGGFWVVVGGGLFGEDVGIVFGYVGFEGGDFDCFE